MKEEEKKDKTQFGTGNFERRTNPRFSADFPLEYSRVDAASKFTGIGCTANASEGGLMLNLPEQLEVGQYIRVKLYLSPEPGLDFIEALCQVAWAEIPFTKDGDLRYGVKFLDISPEAMNRLKDFLDNLAHIKTPLRITP
ncbi:MAG TPA: PilZ domain-containing protein [Thermodesulfobacteriota bacterium]|nr:PilZ domain-containing protein [Thermodesulfobacteriota bacterium]